MHRRFKTSSRFRPYACRIHLRIHIRRIHSCRIHIRKNHIHKSFIHRTHIHKNFIHITHVHNSIEFAVGDFAVGEFAGVKLALYELALAELASRELYVQIKHILPHTHTRRQTFNPFEKFTSAWGSNG